MRVLLVHISLQAQRFCTLVLHCTGGSFHLCHRWATNTYIISCALLTAKAKKLFTLPMADVVGSLVPILPAPATFPIALWSLGPLFAMYHDLSS